MAQPIRNPGSTPIYRETERLLSECLKVADRTPKKGGTRIVANRLIESLLDALVAINLAINELDYSTKYELLTSVFVQIRTAKTCIDALKDYSNHSLNVRILNNRQMPRLCETLESIQNQLAKWRSSVAGKNSH